MSVFKKSVLSIALTAATLGPAGSVQACPPTSNPTSSPASLGPIDGLPPGAVIISSRVVHEAAVVKKTSSELVTPKKAPTPTDQKEPSEPKPKAEPANKPTDQKADSVVEDVPDLQTEEEIEVDVRFAENVIGSAIMTGSDFEAELDITQWSAEAVCLVMPSLGILKPMHVRIAIYRPDGYLVRAFDARLIRRESIRRLVRKPSSETGRTSETLTTARATPVGQ